VEVKNLVSLALFAVAIGMAGIFFALNILGTVTVNTQVMFLGIAVFSLGVAGISQISKRK